MNPLRIRVELNRGRGGVPLDKLAAIAQETMRFLSLFSRDMGFGNTDHKWIAEKFANHSVDFDCRLVETADETIVRRSRAALRGLMANDLSHPELSILIRPETRRQYARIARPLDPQEVAFLGVYEQEEEHPHEWYQLSRELMAEIEQPLTVERESFGEVQGIIHAFFKETERPHLKVRELSSQQLVNCYFEPEMYRAAVEVLAEPDGIVFVEGWCREDPETGWVTEIKVTDFRPAPAFSLEAHRRARGSLPDYTGPLSSAEYVDVVRDA